VPLNAHGLAQAKAAAEKLRGRGIVTIVASPLTRARVTADIASRAIGRPVLIEEGLREVRYGVQEGQPMQPWFPDWIAGTFTPEGAETFAELRARAVAAINRCLAHPLPLLVVGHGAFFRALRSAMGLAPNVRLPNATPLRCEPGDPEWRLIPAE
jgi:broad specificity phosphatase PhoE